MPKNNNMKNKYLELLIDNHPDAMILASIDGEILALNKKAADI
jgi:hypothetical protein